TRRWQVATRVGVHTLTPHGGVHDHGGTVRVLRTFDDVPPGDRPPEAVRGHRAAGRQPAGPREAHREALPAGSGARVLLGADPLAACRTGGRCGVGEARTGAAPAAAARGDATGPATRESRTTARRSV